MRDKSYRHLWCACWGGVAGLAALTGLVSDGLARPVFLAVLAGFTVAAASLAPHQDGLGTRRAGSGAGLRTACGRGLRTGLVAGTVVAATALVGWLVLPLALTAALTSPWFNDLVGPARSTGRGSRDRRARQAQAEPVEITAAALRPAVEILDDEHLARGWRHSFRHLQDADGVMSGLALVNLRQAYLDEMERRQPAGFASWLASGARASSDPTPHLQSDPARTRPTGTEPP
ncbi:hypothetical protein [Nocardioides sp. 1609]|uniref:hypothetical protein n=1 Tax=Nocardioides sp. 1609 TaxID=2508327 RepID=UPI00106F81C5|nr:hypothetical protein [Nocardioides sp. 1609]